jgi:hypothetical protein
VTASVTAGADCVAEVDFNVPSPPPSPRASPVARPTPIRLGGPTKIDKTGGAMWKLSWLVGSPGQTGKWTFVATCSLQGQTIRATIDYQVS